MENQSTVNKWVVLIILFLNVMFGFGGMNVIAPLSSEIDADIGITLAQIGATVAFFTLASPVFSPIGGVLTDRYGARWVLFFAGLVLAVAGSARFFVTGPNQLIALMFIAGLGFACVGPVIPKALSTVFPAAEFGKANGIVFSAFWVGSTLAFSLSTKVLSPFFGGWRETTVAIGVCSAVSAVAWLFVFRDATETEETAAKEQGDNGAEQGSGLATFLRILKIKDILRLSFFYSLCIAALFSILSLLPRVLEDRGLEQPGMLAALLTGAMVAFNILGGMLSDRFGRVPVLVVSALVFGLTMPALLTFSGPLLMLSLLIAGAAAGPIIPVSTAIPVEMPSIGPALAGTALGVLFMIGNLGGFFGPIIAGWVIDTTASPWPAFLLIMAMAWAAPLLLRGLKTR